MKNTNESAARACQDCCSRNPDCPSRSAASATEPCPRGCPRYKTWSDAIRETLGVFDRVQHFDYGMMAFIATAMMLSVLIANTLA